MTLETLMYQNLYMCVPKDTLVSEALLTTVRGFIFAEDEAKKHFEVLNESLKVQLEGKIFLLNEEIDTNASYVINDKHVYFQFVIPRLVEKGVELFYFYHETIRDIHPDIDVYVHPRFPHALRMKCPVCEGVNFSSVYQVFEKPDDVDLFVFKKGHFLECEGCATTIKAPLEITKNDVREYGMSYYNQLNYLQNIEKAIEEHIYHSQIPVYKTFESMLNENFSSQEYPKWLDVGSAGYPTTFKNYNFTTIEPDYRTVEIGRRLFNREKIVCTIVDDLPLDEVYDGIVFHHSFYCLPNPNEALQKCFHLLRDGGVVVVAIGQFFMETPSVFSDNLYLRLEDIYRGETLSVYYNPFSLEYIFAKNGFVLENFKELSHHYHTSLDYRSKYFTFRKQAKSVKTDLLQASYDFSKQLLKTHFADFWERTYDTLARHNNKHTVFIGDWTLFEALNRILPLTNIQAFIDFHDVASNVYRLNGVQILPFSEVYRLTPKTKIVVCSFMYQKDILEVLETRTFDAIFVPTRKSKIENMFFYYEKDEVMTKAFELSQIK